LSLTVAIAMDSMEGGEDGRSLVSALYAV